MTNRHTVPDALDGIRKWTINETGISADGPEDTNDLLRVLREFPQLPNLMRRQEPQPATPNETEQRMRDVINRVLAQGTLSMKSDAEQAAVLALPINPMRLSVAVDRFCVSKAASGETTARTSADRRRLLSKLSDHLVDLGSDPFVHEVGTHHLSTFLDKVPVRRPGDSGETTDIKAAAPRTAIKKISDLRTFFAYAHDELQATRVDPTVGLAKRRKALASAAAKQERHYLPFETGHLQRIFEPKSYLQANKQADEFWAPLIGLHLGTRLQEVVTLQLDAIACEEHSGVWYLDITAKYAKTRNSIRRIPLSDRIVQLGFLDYVEHVRRLGASYLFPHQDFEGSTFQSQPSKNVSRTFGKHLGILGLSEPDLVFHSFRHTVVTSLQDGGTPLQDSMQITGHQAQDHAIRTKAVTVAQSRSVHTSTYSHPDKPRLNVDSPLARLKEHLDRCIRVPLDYDSLRRAADIVKEHTVKGPSGFRSGWPSQDLKYTDVQLKRLS